MQIPFPGNQENPCRRRQSHHPQESCKLAPPVALLMNYEVSLVAAKAIRPVTLNIITNYNKDTG